MKALGLKKSFGKLTILRDISLTVSPGESVAIMGRSGEGKTTLLHILGSLEAPDSGTLELNGQILTRAKATSFRNKELGFVFQAYNLLEDFTTLENVLMPARIGRTPVTREHGLSLLKQVGLEEKADTPAKYLSGGERQRVAIARALCNNPSLILADEPTGNLDRANAEQVGKLLTSLNKSVIIATHDPELAALCDKRYLLKDGRLTLLI
jgi:lipoprotein-releasing system ATP-binding protein